MTKTQFEVWTFANAVYIPVGPILSDEGERRDKSLRDTVTVWKSRSLRSAI